MATTDGFSLLDRVVSNYLKGLKEELLLVEGDETIRPAHEMIDKRTPPNGRQTNRNGDAT